MKKILVFGEILFDIFGSEKKLGGAPLNFACHFSLLGGTPYVISAVGDDENGRNALEEASRYGVDTSLTAVSDLETGYCRVTLSDGVPSYDLVCPVAYDVIPCPEINDGYDGFYFGTLAQRSEKSRETLSKLLEKGQKNVFFDVNIRQHYYDRERLDFSLRHTDILKVSREEIGVFAEVGICESRDIDGVCREICRKYPVSLVVVTLDKDGGMVYDPKTNKKYYSRAPESKVVSTVGGGDSFSAAFYLNYLNGESVETCLERAVTLSDYVVTQLGAVCVYPDELKKRLCV